MKAISLWQPWASLLVHGVKTIETRTWYTGYRGQLLIHAAKKIVNPDEYMSSEMERAIETVASEFPICTMPDFPRGALLGSVDLVDCRPTSRFITNPDDVLKNERGFDETWLGNFAPGRYAWILHNPKLFLEPLPYKGSQGFFEVEINC